MRKNFYNTSRFLLLLIPAVVGLSWVGCKTTTEYVTVNQKCNCPYPILSHGFWRRPAIADVGQVVSPDGKKLAFINNIGTSYFYILDLQTLVPKLIFLKDILPDTASWLRKASCVAVFWCPYSSNKLFLACLEYKLSDHDYNGVGYIYDLSTHSVTRVNPSRYGKYGLWLGNDERGWLKGSKEGVDSILLSSGIYLLQQDSIYPLPTGYKHSFTQSLHTDDVIGTDGLSQQTDELEIYLNSTYFRESHSISGGSGKMSFSPNGRKIALSVVPRTPTTNQQEIYTYGFEEVWIIDRDNITTRDEFASYKLNFQELFCMYSFSGISAEYITDSTLAVSMHKDGDNISPLWEITDKGRIIRQLTK